VEYIWKYTKMERDRFPFEKEIKEERCRQQRLDKFNLRN